MSDGVDSCTAKVRAGGCTLILTTAGSRPITAEYLGDVSYEGSADTETHDVQSATTTTTLESHKPEPSVVGQAINVLYQVVVDPPGEGVPTGDVTVSDGSATCTGSVEVGRCSLIPTSAGTKTITVTYPGNASYGGSSDSDTHEVGSATTVVTVTDIPDTSVVGQPVRVEFTVSAQNGGTPTGDVTVTVDDESDATCSASVAVGFCNIVLTKAGEWALTGTYPGDGNFEPGAGSELHVVEKAATTTRILSDNPDPSNVGQGIVVTFEVTVTAPGAGTPTGLVNVTDGTVNCSAPVSQGNCTLTPTTAGPKTLRATYVGDANFGSSFDEEDHFVQTGSTVVTITSDNPDPSRVGQQVQVSYTVVGQGGQPTGNVTVTVNDGSGANCVSSVAAGTCTITLTRASTTPWTLTASYPGDINFDQGSDTEPHTVNQALTQTAITSVNPGPPTVVGQPITVSFQVSAVLPGTGTPAGQVIVDDGTGATCNANLSGGQGSCALTPLTAGTKSLTATYPENTDPNYGASASPSVQHEVQAQTGNLQVSTTTTGANLDPDGYTVTVDGSLNQAIGVNGQVTFSNLAAGTHNVQLTGVASNCTVSGTNPRNVDVPGGGTAQTAFQVTCAATTGNLQVSASTTGDDLDPDGYTVTVDGSLNQSVGVNGQTTFIGLAAGTHNVQLSGVASNCTVSGSNPRNVDVPPGGTAQATFQVTCTPLTGNLLVFTQTSGTNQDPDGYTVTVDGTLTQGIGLNNQATFANLTTGPHQVELLGVASNCSVSGANPRNVNVQEGISVQTTFEINCAAPASAQASDSDIDEEPLSLAAARPRPPPATGT
ncbi:MAG: hypothetical protein AMS21_11035 [Gemmatimonas sp. SG8_38_2]|nr:MAG: hypothetical protein AMS21_11035 [Gemmatimonas sp. SG8_38_2]